MFTAKKIIIISMRTLKCVLQFITIHSRKEARYIPAMVLTKFQAQRTVKTNLIDPFNKKH